MRRRSADIHQRTVSGGFTLLELLVATAITAVLAALLITITSGVMGVWDRSRGSLTTSNQVKLALDQLATDLEGAIFRNDGGVWFAVSITESTNAAVSATQADLASFRGWLVTGTGSLRLKPSTTEDARSFILDGSSIDACAFGQAGVWLRFFTVQPGSNDGSDSLSAPVAVGYQLCRRRVGSSGDESIAYMLYRAQVRADGSATGQAAGVFQLGYDLDPSDVSSEYNEDDGGESNPGNLLQPNANQALAFNVVDFGVRLYIRDSGTLRLVFPAQPASEYPGALAGEPSTAESAAARAEELQHLVGSKTGWYVPADPYRHVRPDVVDVMVRVLTDEGAAMVQAYEAGTIDGDWWDIVLAHSHVYTRRIEVQGGDL